MSFILSLLVFLTCLQPGLGQCNGTTLVIELELFTKVYIQSPGFQAGKYPQNLSCAWRFDRSRNTSEIIYTFHHKGMGTTPDSISLYGGVNDTGIKLIDTTENLSQDSTTRLVVDHSSLFLLFTTDNVESNDGYGVEMYILESLDYSGTDCLTTKQIQPKSTTQYLTSPSFPQKYPSLITCAWNITTTDEVVVKVIYMDVEAYTSTCYDYVTIGDSKRLCADWEYNIDTTYVFNDSFLITFKSNNQTEKNGFVLSYVESKDNTTEEQTSIKPEVETTTNIQQEEETLSTEAMVGIITGAIAVVSCTGVLIGIVSFLILRRSTSGKSPKYTNDSRETIDTQTTEISAPPRWIPMIDTMWKNNYNPPFLEHESH